MVNWDRMEFDCTTSKKEKSKISIFHGAIINVQVDLIFDWKNIELIPMKYISIPADKNDCLLRVVMYHLYPHLMFGPKRTKQGHVITSNGNIQEKMAMSLITLRYTPHQNLILIYLFILIQ